MFRTSVIPGYVMCMACKQLSAQLTLNAVFYLVLFQGPPSWTVSKILKTRTGPIHTCPSIRRNCFAIIQQLRELTLPLVLIHEKVSCVLTNQFWNWNVICAGL